MISQQPSVMVFGGHPTQQPTVIQTVTQPPPTVQIQGGRVHYLKAHKVLGIIQMVAGCTCFVLSILGFIVGGTPHYYIYFGSGIYSGIIFFITGLLGFMAYRKQNKCLIVACMVMNIIGTCTAVIAMSFASIETSMLNRMDSSSGAIIFQNVKTGTIVTICVLEFIITIVHAAFTCASCCDCCMPREVVRQPAQVTGAIIVQQGAYSVVPQGQVYQYPAGYMPQQQPVAPGVFDQPVVQSYPPGQPNLPPYGPTQTTYPQTQMANPPPINSAFGYNSPQEATAAPPPYSEVDERK